MHATGRSAALALSLAAAACGVAEDKYNAQVAEAARYRKSYEDESQRLKDCEQKVADMGAAVATCQQERKAATAELERARTMAGQLKAEKAVLEKKSSEYEALTKSLASEIQAGRVQISELEGKMTVRLQEKVVFPSGSATINRDGRAALAKVADAFRNVKGRIIRVEGHTDNVPIHTARFPSNWELSAARAIAVVRFLQDEGVDPSLLGAAGFAEYQPIAPNDTPEGRAQNRRIEITLALPPPSLPETK